MADRPYTVLSCGMSIDGYIDCPSINRLPLSNEADFDRVDGVRAHCDAIMVGAATVRNDNPRLLVRSAQRRRQRVALGLAASPVKVTVTNSGCLNPESVFFTAGEVEKLVYCASPAVPATRARLEHLATVIDAGPEVAMRWITEDLHQRGICALLVEGGGSVHTQFLTADVADELQLVVAPLFVGDPQAHRFVNAGTFPWKPGRRAPLVEVRQIGDVVLLRYALSQACDEQVLRVAR